MSASCLAADSHPVDSPDHLATNLEDLALGSELEAEVEVELEELPEEEKNIEEEGGLVESLADAELGEEEGSGHGDHEGESGNEGVDDPNSE